MAFPVSPTNGQIATVNGIRYSYNTVQNSWVRISSGKYTAAATGPSNPATGDHWYNTTEDTLYEYVSDGVSSYWLDIQSAFVGGNAGSVLSNTTIAGNLTMTGNILPSANVTYDLGSSTYRFRDLWLSGNTIRLGAATISATGDTLTLTNPGGGTYALSGSAIVGTSTNTYGNITVAANVVTANVYADRFFYSNGVAFSSSNFGNTQVAAYLASSNAVVGTAAITVPSGTTAQRPGSPSVGMIRYNYTVGGIEVYLPSGGWTNLISDRYTVEYLVVAGGGGGGSRHSGGGGAGGLLTTTGYTVTPTTAYSVVVGAGGAGSTNGGTATNGSPGIDSSFGAITATGGGYGGGTAPATGGNGGSGGGGGNGSLGGSGTAGQGYAGGKNSPANDYHGGGGGGAGGLGGDVTGAAGGIGGLGLASDITGTSVIYACGGGGSAYQGLGSGGDGGAGGSSNVNGGKGAGSTSGSAGTSNTGTGGGGGSASEGAYNGGSGVVIIRYLGAQRGSGGTYSTANGYSIHKFTASGTFTA